MKRLLKSGCFPLYINSECFLSKDNAEQKKLQIKGSLIHVPVYQSKDELYQWIDNKGDDKEKWEPKRFEIATYENGDFIDNPDLDMLGKAHYEGYTIDLNVDIMYLVYANDYKPCSQTWICDIGDVY